jgi:MazG family protein
MIFVVREKMQDNSALGRAMATVRDLRRRCAWDRAQTRETLRPYLVEEVLELDQALADGAVDAIQDELSDLLLHLAFQLVIAEEREEFGPEQVASRLEWKMRRRHPHLFGQGKGEPWEHIKRKERRGQVLSGIVPTLPSLLMAYRLQERAASVGFDWPDATGALEKVWEELAEVETHLDEAGPDDATTDPDPNAPRQPPSDQLIEEVGDLLFAVVNLARTAGVQPGPALDGANRKFRTRFEQVELLAAEREIDVATAGLEVLDRLWEEVKRTALSPSSGIQTMDLTGERNGLPNVRYPAYPGDGPLDAEAET